MIVFSKRFGFPFTAVLLFLGVVSVFLPELVSFGWHVLHGRAANYRGWSIPVPSGWFAIRQGEGLTLERMLHFPIRQATPIVVFLSMHTRTEFPFHPEEWEAVQVGIQNGRGYRLAATRELVMGGEPGYCWEFVKKQEETRWWITCLMPSGGLSADFSGQHEFAPAFYAILPQIVRTSGSI